MSQWKWALVAVYLATLTGCGQQAAAPSAEHAALGQKFLLGEEPAGAIGIIDFRESPAAADAANVTLVGRIGGGKLTWSNQSASFLLSDPAHEIAAGSEHECHSDNCPFCKGKQSADRAQAIVLLTDDNGQVPPIDARKLLPLAEGQTVVVSGRAEVNAIGQLVVHARGLYVRR
jgi:hypothetical protein